MEAEYFHHTVVNDAIEGRMFLDFGLVVEEYVRGLCSLTEEGRENRLPIRGVVLAC